MDFTNNSQQPLDIHVFRCSSFEGQPIETEGNPNYDLVLRV